MEKESIKYPPYPELIEIDDIKSLIISLWTSHLKLSLDTLSGIWTTDYNSIHQSFYRYEWNEVFDFLEFIAEKYKNRSKVKSFINVCNYVFEQEISGYRFIDSKITEITSETEIHTIEQALAYQDKFTPISKHINTALIHLSRKENPDYRNSMKESISAVESIFRLVTNNKKATLSTILNTLKKDQQSNLHPALIEAFNKLYAYTNDSDGIRHSMLEKSNVDFEDAKFMLVSCSAFVNYVKGKAMKAEINLSNTQEEKELIK